MTWSFLCLMIKSESCMFGGNIDQYLLTYLFIKWVRVTLFDATFDIISVISWQSVLLVVETGLLLQVIDKHYHIMLY